MYMSTHLDVKVWTCDDLSSNMSFEVRRCSVNFYAFLKPTHIHFIIEMKLRWVLQSMQ